MPIIDLSFQSLFQASTRAPCVRKTASASLKSLAIPRSIPAFPALQTALFKHNGSHEETSSTLSEPVDDLPREFSRRVCPFFSDTMTQPPRPPRPATPPIDEAAAREALGWLHTARFLTTAAQLHQLPPHTFPEIAFVGRSNAGKSTAINTLTQQNQLAFASKRPGRTQHINLFSLGRQGETDAVLADLPGYGYAAVPKDDKWRWQQVMANYLVSRENLLGIVMLCDPRHGLKELDEALLEVIRPRVEEGLKFLILLTKADKLTRSDQAKALSIAKLQAGGGEVKLFSALKRQGVAEAALWLRGWVPPAQVVETP